MGSFSAEGFVAALARPRRILVMVKAGPAVDAVLEELAGHLDQGDLLIDGGNSYFEDTVRREQAMASRGLRFLGTGVSGGEEGALKGPSIMPGGTAEAYGLVEQSADHHRRPGRRDAVLPPGRPRRRRPLREDGPQRHRVRRHAAHRRGL